MKLMSIPTLEQAEALLQEAERMNPGPWVAHSVNVARAGRLIAERHPALDPERAYILGLLHDIGRRAGRTGMRHVIDGWTYLNGLGYPASARICLTHSFAHQDPRAVFGAWDCSENEFQAMSAALLGLTYDAYDRLFQLCDALAVPEGFCLIEKRLVDVLLRYAQYGLGEWLHPKWQALFQIQRELEAELGCSVYALLPGVVETTFGFS